MLETVRHAADADYGLGVVGPFAVQAARYHRFLSRAGRTGRYVTRGPD